MTEGHFKTLEDPAFTSLIYDERIIPLNMKGLNSIYKHIKRGDCIVLHYNGYNGIQYHYPNSLNKNPIFICININPHTNLLDEDEWPEFLQLAGYEHTPYGSEKVSESWKKNPFLFTFGYSN